MPLRWLAWAALDCITTVLIIIDGRKKINDRDEAEIIEKKSVANSVPFFLTYDFHVIYVNIS